MIRKNLDAKFKDLDNFLNKKVMRNLQDLTNEVRERLDGVERNS